MAEDFARLGDAALKLERYRYNIASALSWVIFGMIFGSLVTLGSSLVLFGFQRYEIFLPLIAIAGIAGGYIYHKFWKYLPMESDVAKRWRIGTILLFIPFMVSYSVIPIKSPLYYNTIWYPSLGFGLLLCGLYAERGLIRVMPYAGILIILTSLVLIPISKMPMNVNTVLAAGLLCNSMMMMIYFATAIYVFFKAQRVIYA